MKPLLAALLPLSAAVAFAADPVAVPAGKFADLKAPAVKGSSVVWRVYPPPVQRAPDLSPGRLIFAGKPGVTYVVTAITIDFGKQLVTEDDTEVTFAGKADPSPEPGPKPDPKPVPPDPKPEPVAGTLYLVVVEETSQRTPEQARVLADVAFWGGLAKRDVQWRLYDKDSADTAKLGYLPHANRAGLPAALVVDRWGKVHDARRVTTVAGLDAMLREVGR